MKKKYCMCDKVITKDGIKCMVLFYDTDYHDLLWVQGQSGKTDVFSVFEDEVEELKE